MPPLLVAMQERVILIAAGGLTMHHLVPERALKIDPG
jgi:hypothetical protein